MLYLPVFFRVATRAPFVIYLKLHTTLLCNDDVITWKRFLRPLTTDEWRNPLTFYLLLAWIIWWTSSRVAGAMWRHKMGTFSALLALCEGNPPVTDGSPHKGQWRWALMISLICVWTNSWANNRDGGDLRRHHAHYDVTVMDFRCHMWRHWNALLYTGVLGRFVPFIGVFTHILQGSFTDTGEVITLCMREIGKICCCLPIAKQEIARRLQNSCNTLTMPRPCIDI